MASPARAVMILPWPAARRAGRAGRCRGGGEGALPQRAMDSSIPTVRLRTASSISLAIPLVELAMTEPRSVCSTSAFDVNALDDLVNVHPVHHGVHVDLPDHPVHIDRCTIWFTSTRVTIAVMLTVPISWFSTGP